MRKNTFLLLLFVFCMSLIGMTFSYFQSSLDSNGEFKTGKFEATSYENFTSPVNWSPGDTTEKNVYVTNNGDDDMAVRISLEEEWKSSDNVVLSNTQNNEKIAIINLVNQKDWVKKGNYYYYKYRLPVDDSTSIFMDSVTFNNSIDFNSNCVTTNNIKNCSYSMGDYEGATYNLTVKIETIQYSKYRIIWNPNIALVDDKPETGADILIKKANKSSSTSIPEEISHEMYAFDHPATSQTPAQTDYRYIGSDPYNYVKFNCDNDGENCEIWRILGVFDVDDGYGHYEKRMKLIRGRVINSNFRWSSNSSNKWNDSNIKKFLNNEYYNRTGDASNYGLKESAIEMIDDSLYYLGGNGYVGGSTDFLYSWERGTNTYSNNPYNWIGKVGIMYPSDVYYPYAMGVDNYCYNSPYQCIDRTKQKNWIIASNLTDNGNDIGAMWLISADTDTSLYSFNITSDATFRFYQVYGYYSIRPVIYLSKNVSIKSGTGKSDDPYVLEKDYTASEYLIKNATNDGNIYDDSTKDNLFAFTHSATNQTPALTDYRYIGNSPKNHVKFNCDNNGLNCEDWRIIGIFNVDYGNGFYKNKIKLIRGSSFSQKINFDMTTNNWTNSTIMNFLNNDYYNGIDVQYKLYDSARDLIDDAAFYLGGKSFDNTNHFGSTESIYEWERGNTVFDSLSKFKWKGKVGLAYPSDYYYTYANGVDNNCYNDPYVCNSNISWIFKSNNLNGSQAIEDTCSISPELTNGSNIIYINNLGNLANNSSSNNFGIRPVVYLNSDVKIKSGNGEENNPYVFSY